MTAMPPWLDQLLPPNRQWTPVRRGESGAIVLHDRVSQHYLKAVSAAHTHELIDERDRIAWLSTTGVPGPQVLDWISTHDAVALVTTAVPGISADQLGAAQLLRAWPSIIDALHDMHSIPVASCPYGWSLEDMMTAARETVAQNRVHTEFLPADLQSTSPAVILQSLEYELTQRLEQEEADNAVCHGDACLPNILVDPETLRVAGWIDLGRLGCADPYSDIALLLATARGTWPDEESGRHAEDFFADRYGIALDAGRRDFYLRLDPLTW